MTKLLAALVASLFAMSTAFAASHAGAPMPSQAGSGMAKKDTAMEKKDAKPTAKAAKKTTAKKTTKAKKVVEKKS